MKNNLYSLLAVVLVLVAGLYYVLQVEDEQMLAAPSTIRVGVLPDESMAALRGRYAPLLSYLSAEIGLQFSLIESADYDDLVALVVEDRIDLAYLGGYTFVQTQALHGIVPLVMREVDTRFTSYFLVSSDNPLQRLEDFTGRKFSFGNRLSTSGHLMPRYLLQQEKNIVPEEFFGEIRFSGTHDKTAYLVRDGSVDLGVANSEIIRTMIRDGRLAGNDLRVIWETPPYSDYVWVVQSHLPEGLRDRIRDAFLELDSRDDHHRKILQGMGARVFLPAGSSDFDALKEVARSLQLLVGGG